MKKYFDGITKLDELRKAYKNGLWNYIQTTAEQMKNLDPWPMNTIE